jgi:hypothetical protein
MRQMHWLFDALDLPYDKEHRKMLDLAIRDELKTPADFHCPEVWAAIKSLSDDERMSLIPKMQARLG